ncbi:MAG: hypothetical protein ACOCZV_01900 [Nanoarchaeota archaeon]
MVLLRRHGNGEYSRICPVCNSSEVRDDPSNQTIRYIGQIETMICDNCGFTGTFFPEVKDSKKPKTRTRE